jgi:chemotaxis protein MotC
MIRTGVIIAVLLALAGAARAEAIAAAAPEPYQLVRRLQMLQDDIARGNLAAHNAQPNVLKSLGDKFKDADAAVWKDPRNSRAVVTFLLSGGAPDIVTELRARVALNVDAAILDGAIAYVEGRPDDARAKLGTVDARTLPATLGAEIALVQSALSAQSDVSATIDRLDEVRLLMPGTLVEEAALRREIFLVGQADDFDKFESLALQYFRRFRHSIYAGNFRQRFALAVARFSFAQQTDRFPRLIAVLDNLDQPSQRTFYLLIARTALLRGKTEMTVLAAERVAALADDGSNERTRARLYSAIARLVTSAHDDAQRELQGIDEGQLSDRDAELLDAALKLGRNVRKSLPVVAERPAGAVEETAMRPRIDFSTSLAAVGQAQKLLDESNARLKEQTR